MAMVVGRMTQILRIFICLALSLMASPSFAAKMCEAGLKTLSGQSAGARTGSELYAVDHMDGEILKVPLIGPDGESRRIDPTEYRFTVFISEAHDIKKITGFKLGRRLIKLKSSDYGVLDWQKSQAEISGFKASFPRIPMETETPSWSIDLEHYWSPRVENGAAGREEYWISRQMLNGPDGYLSVEFWIYKLSED